ncbi:hypothetical protein [Fluviicola taffensis]|uniref:hypothetical protein n=1 Tax=Fluviicola taffensis TaxID=191579 RepID=UPI003137BBD0
MSEPTNPVQLFSELLGSPLGELISSVGQGVGDAQAALDQGALEQTLEIYDLSKDGTRPEDELKLLTLIREIGYQPTFYTIPETEVEAQISLSLDLKSQQTSPIGGTPLSKFKVNATPLNAGNVNRFGLQANAMAKLKFKIVPVPPPQNAAEIRNVPDLSTRTWNEETKELLDNLGFTYELRTPAGELITTEDLTSSISLQSPDAGTIANISKTPLVITLGEICKVPELVAEEWSAETKQLIQDLGISYELRTPDGILITDEETAEGLPITGQIPEAGTFVNTTSTLLVLTVTISF